MISDMQSKAIALLGILVVCSKLNHALLDPPSSWLDSVNKKLETFQAKLDQCERQIGMLNSTINRRLGTGTIAFTAFRKNNLVSMSMNQVIIFDDILTNVGNAYNKIDGHFQAPVTGTYIFVVTLTSLAYKEASLSLVKDGQHLAHALASSRDPSEHETVTMATVVSMTAGERVWVQNFLANGGLDGYDWSQFSGHLIA